MRKVNPARPIWSGATALLAFAVLGGSAHAQLFFNVQPQRHYATAPQRMTAQPQRSHLAQPQRPEDVLPQRSAGPPPVSTGLQGCANQRQAEAENRIASCTSVISSGRLKDKRQL